MSSKEQRESAPDTTELGRMLAQLAKDTLYIARRLKSLEDLVGEQEIAIKFLDGFTDLVLSKQKDVDKMLWRFIIHLAKNGEIRSLIEALMDKSRAKPLEVVVAFDGDEAGIIAANRFAVNHLCGNPKKFQIGANLADGIKHINEDLQEHFHYHTDKKTNKDSNYIYSSIKEESSDEKPRTD